MSGHHECLLQILRDKDAATLTEYIQLYHPDLNQCDSLGWGLIHECVELGKMDLLKLLIKEGANPNLRTKSNGETIIFTILGKALEQTPTGQRLYSNEEINEVSTFSSQFLSHW
jgi:ankyrin repeat protein